MEETAAMGSRRALVSVALSVLPGLGWLRNGEFAPVTVAEAKGFLEPVDVVAAGTLLQPS
jgi:hypothetical protein